MINSKIFAEDIQGIIADRSIDWEKLRGSSVLVTGATGAIGRGIVSTLGELNRANGFGVNIYAVGRNLEKGRELEQVSGVKFIAADIREKLDIPYQIEYIIHCAAVTESAKMVSDPVGLIDTEVQGGKNILELAREKNIKGMVYTSSMEVYGTLDLPEVRESDLGYLDLTAPRSSYPQSKRMFETMCNCYHSQYGLPVNIARLGMTFGAGADFMNDKRVWAMFARCAVNGSPIVLKTTGESLSSIVYTADAIRGILLVLLNDTRGETYNIASARLKIRELAEKVAKRFSLKVIIDLPDDARKTGFAGDFKWPLNTDKIKSIGWIPEVPDVEDMFLRTINDI